MRQQRDRQITILDALIDEDCIEADVVLEAILDALRRAPDISQLVLRDLTRGLKQASTGRPGVTAEQLLGFLIVMRRHDLSYRLTRDRIADSIYLRRFIGIGWKTMPDHTAFNRAALKLQPETVEEINQLIVQVAIQLGVEDGTRSRVDSTVVETNIRHPSDSQLLFDVVRVLTRETSRLLKLWPDLDERFPNRMKRAKRRLLEINSAAKRRGERRVQAMRKAYKDLLDVAVEVSDRARTVARRSLDLPGLGPVESLRAEALRTKIESFADQGDRVISQTNVICHELGTT